MSAIRSTRQRLAKIRVSIMMPDRFLGLVDFRPAAYLRETDCVAGHVGLKLRNAVANYAFETSHRSGGIEPNSRHRDHSRLSCCAGGTQLRLSGFGGVLAQTLVSRRPPKSAPGRWRRRRANVSPIFETAVGAIRRAPRSQHHSGGPARSRLEWDTCRRSARDLIRAALVPCYCSSLAVIAATQKIENTPNCRKT
jgi:hypothetical protein